MKSPKKEGPTQQERALADVSRAQWADYVERFRPAEAALIRKAEFTAGEKAQVKGEASADAAAAFKGLNRSTIAANETAGANVASGKSKLAIAANTIASGKTTGLGQAMAVTGGEIDSDAQKTRIAGIGRGIAHDVTANLSRGAHRATRLALAESAAKYERNQDIISGVAGVAGAATRKFGPDLFGESLEEIDISGLPKKRYNTGVAPGTRGPI